MSLWTSLELIIIIYSSGLKILSKFMKLYNKDFPIGYFTADFFTANCFLAQVSKIEFCENTWLLSITSKHCSDFFHFV